MRPELLRGVCLLAAGIGLYRRIGFATDTRSASDDYAMRLRSRSVGPGDWRSVESNTELCTVIDDAGVIYNDGKCVRLCSEKIIKAVMYRNGKRHGYNVGWWWTTHKLYKKMQLVNGKRHGNLFRYNLQGVLTRNVQYANDVVCGRTFVPVDRTVG